MHKITEKDELIRRVLDGECSPEDEERHETLLAEDIEYCNHFNKLKRNKEDLKNLASMDPASLRADSKDMIMERVIERRGRNLPGFAKPEAAEDENVSAPLSTKPLPSAPRVIKKSPYLYAVGLMAACGAGLVLGFFLARHTMETQPPILEHSVATTSLRADNELKRKFSNTIDNENQALNCPELTKVRFVLHAPKAEKVMLVGDFNDWSNKATPMNDEEGKGIWRLTVPLEPGTYRYKFLVDGERWVNDPAADGKINDGFGGFNSLIRL